MRINSPNLKQFEGGDVVKQGDLGHKAIADEIIKNFLF